MTHNQLYCFISHYPMILNDVDRLSTMMSNINYDSYIIVYGGEKQDINHPHVKHLDCPDDYCSLPIKINSLCKFVTTHYSHIEYFCKIDRTTDINYLYDKDLFDYSGNTQKFRCGTFHFDKCIKESKWYNTKFHIDNIVYCSGPVYFLSNKAAKIVSHDNELYNNHVYEDCYVGDLLRQNNVLPTHIDVNPFFYDVAHPKIFKRL